MKCQTLRKFVGATAFGYPFRFFHLFFLAEGKESRVDGLKKLDFRAMSVGSPLFVNWIKICSEVHRIDTHMYCVEGMRLWWNKSVKVDLE